MPRRASAKQLNLAKKIHRQNRGMIGRLLGNRRCFRVTAREKAAFLRAMREAFSAHYLSSHELQGLCQEQDFYPWDLKRQSQIERIPRSDERDFSRSRSQAELRRLRGLAEHMFGELGLVNSVKTNYLRLASTDQFLHDLLQGMTRLSYSVDTTGPDSVEWDSVLTLQCLERFEASGRPLRLLGSPQAIAPTMTEILEHREGKPFRFGPNSYVFVSGGWTCPDSVSLNKREFREQVSRWLGLPCRNIRDVYCPAGHDLPYVECEALRYHIPCFSKIVVRDSQTFEVLSPGKKGVLHFLTPYPKLFRKMSLLSADEGMLLEKCRCGRKSPVLKLFGATR